MTLSTSHVLSDDADVDENGDVQLPDFSVSEPVEQRTSVTSSDVFKLFCSFILL